MELSLLSWSWVNSFVEGVGEENGGGERLNLGKAELCGYTILSMLFPSNGDLKHLQDLVLDMDGVKIAVISRVTCQNFCAIGLKLVASFSILVFGKLYTEGLSPLAS